MDALPNELLERILKRLYREDLPKCRLVSRRLCDLVSPILFANINIVMPRRIDHTAIAYFHTMYALAAAFGQHIRSLRIKNCTLDVNNSLALPYLYPMLQACSNVTRLELIRLKCTNAELRAVLSLCRGIQHLELFWVFPLGVPSLTTAILPLFGSLQTLDLRLLPNACQWQDMAALQRVISSLTSLSFTMDQNSKIFHRHFLESKHRADHDPDCDTCTNPWLSVTSLSISMPSYNIRVSELPAMVAFLCLKFPNLKKLAIICSLDYFNRSKTDPEPSSFWRCILDPAIAHWSSLTSITLEHICADVIMDAVYEFTSVSGVSASPLASLTVKAVKDFGSKYTMGLLTAFPSLHTLTIFNKWPDRRYTDVPAGLPLGNLPLPTYGHPLRDLYISSTNPTHLLRISELCPQLTSASFAVDTSWTISDDSFLALRDEHVFPDECMPSIVDQLPIVQKFKQNTHGTIDSRVVWLLLPYSTRLTNLRVTTCYPESVVAYYIQNPSGNTVNNQNTFVTMPNDPLDFTGSYFVDGKIIVTSHPHAAFDTNSAPNQETTSQLHRRYTMVIVAPCRADVFKLGDPYSIMHEIITKIKKISTFCLLAEKNYEKRFFFISGVPAGLAGIILYPPTKAVVNLFTVTPQHDTRELAAHEF